MIYSIHGSDLIAKKLFDAVNEATVAGLRASRRVGSSSSCDRRTTSPRTPAQWLSFVSDGLSQGWIQVTGSPAFSRASMNLVNALREVPNAAYGISSDSADSSESSHSLASQSSDSRSSCSSGNRSRCDSPSPGCRARESCPTSLQSTLTPAQ